MFRCVQLISVMKDMVQKISGNSGQTPMLLVLMLSALGVTVGSVMQKYIENSNYGIRIEQDDRYLRQGCTEAMEQLSQLLGSGVLNINEQSMRFVPNSHLPSSISSEIVGDQISEYQRGGRNWNLSSSDGSVKVRTCAEVEMNEGDMSQMMMNTDHTIPNQPCQHSRMTATIWPEKILDPVENPEYEHLVWKKAVVRANCQMDSDKKTLESRARINFLPPSQICNFENEKTNPYCSVDHCRYMMPLMVENPEQGSSENRGDVYFQKGDQLSEDINLKLVPNPSYVAKIKLPVPRNIPTIAAYRNSEDAADQPLELISFIKQSICAGLNNPFKGYQGVEGTYDIEDYFSGERDENGFVEFGIPAFSQIDSDAGQQARRALTFQGYLYFDRNTEFFSKNPETGGGGSLARNWDTELQQQDPEYHKKLLHNGCVRTVGVSDADFCSRVRLTHASFSYTYPRKRLCHYKGPSYDLVSHDEYKKILSELRPDLDVSRLYKWEESDLSLIPESSEWRDTNYQQTGIFPLAGAESIQTYEDPQIFFHHTATETSSLSKESAKVPHDFSGVIESSIDAIEVRSVTESYQKICSQTDESSGQCLQWEAGEKLTDAEKIALPDADMITQTKLKERQVILQWKADCSEVIDTIPGESIEIQPEAMALCNYRETPVRPVVEKKFDRCYYIAYYNSENRLGCTVNSPSAVGANPYICRNSNGCFARGTPVLMADGQSKAVEQIVQGDFVRNPVTGQSSRVSAVTVGPQQKPMLRIFYGEGKKLESTWNHPFLTPEGLMRADQLSPGQKLLFLGDHLYFTSVTRIEEIPLDSERLVWNLLLEKDELSTYSDINGSFSEDFMKIKDLQQHVFIANGVVTGDYHIQSLENFEEVAKWFRPGENFPEAASDNEASGRPDR
ncbi:MAG: hypothetical protein H6618_05255 [Deltaproteobacteria bacterium]|nr:hypothetical protein [Deltaproteobacteria bacterium]